MRKCPFCDKVVGNDPHDFSNSLSKFVAKSFVIPSNHWRHSAKL